CFDLLITFIFIILTIYQYAYVAKLIICRQQAQSRPGAANWHINKSAHYHMINKVRIYTFRWIYLSVYSFLNGSFLLLQTDKA
ncbi:MAG: hypothetical protein LUD40_05830, partial [Phocaeicola dorei]|nr:hypothetical protein [Phocaeicola dorei]